MLKGINLGSGNWKYKNWIGYDKLNNDYLNENTILPHKNNSLNYVYSCHFFEHIHDNTINNLLKESYRILKNGGIIRIVVPDFQLMHNKYVNNDYNFFYKTTRFKGRPEWKKYNVEYSIETILAHWFSNYDEGYPDNGNGYRGPPRNLKSSEIREKCLQLETEKFSEWLVSNIPNGNNITTQHINCPTMKKLKPILKNIGFKEIKKVSAQESNIDDVLKSSAFNSEKRRKHYSLFIEAKK